MPRHIVFNYAEKLMNTYFINLTCEVFNKQKCLKKADMNWAANESSRSRF